MNEHTNSLKCDRLVELRKKMGAACAKESKKYCIENIIPQWMSLFEELLAKKRKHKSA